MTDTNPDHYKVDNADFIKYMDDPQIKGFGDWMFANGYNAAEMGYAMKNKAKMAKSIRTVAYRTLGCCPSCGRELDSYHDGNSGEHITHFCYNCGQAVKWDAGNN